MEEAAGTDQTGERVGSPKPRPSAAPPAVADRTPPATLTQIEPVSAAPLAPVRAQVVEAPAQASPRQDWRQAPRADQPGCSVCGTPLQARGRHRRRRQTTGGASLELERPDGVCPLCGPGRFPPR